ncbi:energy transducer TonB [Vibrio tapetis]|uniref:TonB C-terminal domain-containing protein n=1 Tax=Vibrio tapetis subsp. tapetis TaxID=1671868 RepID=A0A2N8ZNC8_9VIBR|nr:energy transducer TonB [Vibrio tapetis]SON53402.1 putative Protein TonB [Vibrio tapetis subsp. tapetis]
MELKRYLVFAGISLIIHGVAFSANYKPMTIAPISENVGSSVSIQLIQRSSTQPNQQSVSEAKPFSKTQPEPARNPKPEKATGYAKDTKRNTITKPRKQLKTLKPTEPINKELVTNKAATKKVPRNTRKAKTAKDNVKTVETNKADTVQVKKQAVTFPEKVDKPIVDQVLSKTSAQEDTAQPQQQVPPSAPKMVKKPSFSAKPTPINYPRNAKRRNIEGLVLVEIWIDEQGKQTKQIVVDSSGYPMLDQAALNAITQWQFKSYRDKGQLIAHRVQVPISFELN